MRQARAQRADGSWTASLPFPVFLAVRYLRSSRRDAFVTLLASLAAAGIAIGTAALVLILAALSGLQAFLREDVLARTPHIEVSDPGLTDADYAASLATRLAAVEGVRSVRRVQHARGWAVIGGSARTLEMVGYEGMLPAYFPSAFRLVDERGSRDGDATGDAAPSSDSTSGTPSGTPSDARPSPAASTPGLWVGTAQASAWGLAAGDALELVSPRPTLSPFGPTPRVVRVPMVGTFRTGSTEQVGEARVAIPLAAANRLFGTRGMRLSVETDGLSEALEVAPRLAAALPASAHMATWSDLNRPLFFALRLEKSAMFVSVFLIVPVAAMALVTALTLLVAAKRGEIGMLRAMGATAGDMRRAFACLGTAVGLAGVASGLGLGALLAVVSDQFHLVSPPGNVYFVDHLPFRLQAADLISITVATALMTLLATLWAARRAGAFEPVEALRA